MRQTSADISEETFFRSLTAIFFFTLTLSLVQVFLVSAPSENLYSDMLGYIDRAERVAAGTLSEIGTFRYFYPPGAAYLYAIPFLFVHKQTALIIISILQCLCIAGSNMLAVATAARLFGAPRAALALGVAIACYWPFYAMGSFVLSEIPFAFLLLLAQFLAVVALQNGSTLKHGFCSGLIFGVASLFRSQGVCGLFGVLVTTLFFGERVRRFKLLFTICCGFALPLVAQIGASSFQNGALTPYIASNDAFNMYLGQSRREGVGCYDHAAGFFYIFFNDIPSTQLKLFPTIAFPRAITDRSYFFDQVAELWRAHPFRQTLWGTKSIFELHSILPRWPIRNIPGWASLDQLFVALRFLLISLPALCAVILAIQTRRFQMATVLLATPIAVLSAMAFLTHGQPRYLVPFEYNLFLLAVPLYLALSEHRRVCAVNDSLGRAVATSCLVVLAFLGVARSVELAYARTVPTRSDGSQHHYWNIHNLSARSAENLPLLWVEFGKEGELISSVSTSTFPASPEQRHVTVDRFEIAPPWPNRQIGWHIDTKDNGRLTVRIPKQLFTETGSERSAQLHLFMTDGDGFSRMSAIWTAHHVTTASDLHNGRWISLPISPEEVAAGTVIIHFKRLAGPSVSLSALAVTG